VSESLASDGVVLKVSHHRVKLRHRIADGCARCEYHASVVGYLVDITALKQHIRGLLCIGGRKTCHVSHLRVEEQILVIVCLVHIQTVNAELFKGDYIILAGTVLQFL